MRIESITVRNYRVHRECTVELDAARTLIGGPNESGKSTLIEAAHRALFLRAKAGGEMQKGMVSRLYAGHPEVEVGFEARGRRWRVLKRFSGASGTASLTAIGGSSWSGEEAEAKLGELLGTAAVGKHAARRVDEQWAHLWIWQGCAGDDPTDHANTHCTELLARLQGEGGAAVVQSACDQRVADATAEKFAAIFKGNREARAGSELALAEAEEVAAREAVAAARATCERLEKAAADFAAAEQAIRAAEQALAQLQPQQREVEEKLARVAALVAEEKLQAPAATAVAEKFQALADADAHIRRLRSESQAAEQAIFPLEAEEARLIQAEGARRKSDVGAEAAWQQASEAVRAMRLRSELAEAQVQRIEKTAARAALLARLEQVRALRKELAAEEAALAQIPEITAGRLRALQKLESELGQATAARDAMAAGLEVIASDEPVRIGGRALAAGQNEILTEETEIEIGAGIRLRIRPGGGTSLAAARDQVRAANEGLRRELDDCGLATVQAAADALSRRQQLEGERKTKQAQLAALGAETIEDDFAAAETGVTVAAAEVQRRAARAPDVALPETLEAARALASAFAQELSAAERRDSAADAERKAAAEQLRQAGERLEAHRQSFLSKKQEAANLAAQLRLLIETHGSDETRGARLAELSAARTGAQAVLSTIRQALAQLQPELLARDRDRLGRSLAQHSASQREGEERRAMARGELQRDGTSDPAAELALAEARLRSASERLERERRRADGIALLHELFVAEQKALAEQFTRPLAARISSYLECLFGPGARAEVTLEANNFTGLRLIRPTHGDGAFSFDDLSGGTREQLAAAMRLALAEVLAEAHDGCLPVVFDDAFAYSDPERVLVLQRMLDIAASRGLQVIVLSCNPADYAALGARQITLRMERAASESGAAG